MLIASELNKSGGNIKPEICIWKKTTSLSHRRRLPCGHGAVRKHHHALLRPVHHRPSLRHTPAVNHPPHQNRLHLSTRHSPPHPPWRGSPYKPPHRSTTWHQSATAARSPPNHQRGKKCARYKQCTQGGLTGVACAPAADGIREGVAARALS